MAYVNQSRKRTEIDFRGLICNSLNIQVSSIMRFLRLNPASITSPFVLLYFVLIHKYHLCVPGFGGMGFDFNAAAFPFPP